MLEWEWWNDLNTSRVWITILLLANWQEREWQGVVIPRGSFPTSYEKLAVASGLSVKQVRRAINNLEKTGEITRKTTNKYQIITVEKYDFYQNMDTTKGRQKADKGQSKGNQRADKGQQLNKDNKEINNINTTTHNARAWPEELNEPFEEFMSMRKSIGKPMTKNAVNRLWTKLEKMATVNGEFDAGLATAILLQSVDNCWQGIYELKESNGGYRSQHMGTRPADGNADGGRDIQGIPRASAKDFR